MCERSSLRCFRFHGFYPASGLEYAKPFGGSNRKKQNEENNGREHCTLVRTFHFISIYCYSQPYEHTQSLYDPKILIYYASFVHSTAKGPQVRHAGRHVSLVFCFYSYAFSILRLGGRSKACGGGF